MRPIVDFYDLIEKAQAVADGDVMSKVAHLQKTFHSTGLAGEAVSKDRSGIGADGYALRFITKQGQDVRYRIDTPAQTALSMVAFGILKDGYGPEETVKVAGANLVNACGAFGIPVPNFLSPYADEEIGDNIAPAPVAVQKTEKVADVGTYALPEHQKYPLNDVGDVYDASAYFDAHANQFACQDRPTFARAVLEKAGQLNMDITTLSPLVHAFGHRERSPLLKHAIAVRKSAAQKHVRPEEANTYKQALDKLVKISALDPEALARALFSVDTHFGMDKHADVPDAWTSVYYNPTMHTQDGHTPDEDILLKVAQGVGNGILTVDAIRDTVASEMSGARPPRHPVLRTLWASLPDSSGNAPRNMPMAY